MKPEVVKKQDVMTLSDSDDVQTISSGSDDNKDKEKAMPGKESVVGFIVLTGLNALSDVAL